ncbi:MAG: hypothetical protein NTX50_11210 [Candidatus Sumerlaeota bacterium]|nr:hypothetical protein [Candidatus Sumerlaeota bacterium]
MSAAFSGCSTVPVRVFRINKQGQNVLYKRYAKNVAVDYYYRFSNTAYRPSTGTDFEITLSADQQALLEDLGQPDLIRVPYTSKDNELVTEWAYTGYHHIAQFIESQLAYEGPMTDYEKTLLELGYPDSVSELTAHGDIQWTQWVYKKPRITRLRIITLAGDKIIQDQFMN